MRKLFSLLLAVPLLLISTPAYGAGHDIGSLPGSDSHGGAGWTGSATVCKGGQGWTAGTQTYDAWPGCNGGQALNAYSNCQIGELIYRFYGTKEDPTSAYTVSYAWSPEACDTGSTKFVDFVPNPADAGISNLGGPWNIGTRKAAWNPHYEVTFAATPNDGRARVTTSPNVFRRVGTCANSQGTLDVAQYFKPSMDNDELAQAIRKAVMTVYNQAASVQGPAYAASIVNATLVNGQLQFNDHTPCSSDFDFSDDSQQVHDRPGSQHVFGACNIAVTQYSREYRYADGINQWATYTTAPQTLLGRPQSGAAVSDPILARYRSMMQSDGQKWNVQAPQSNPGANGGDKARYLASMSDCAWGTGALTQDDTNSVPESGAPVQASVTTPDVAQVGGSATTVTLGIQTAGQPLCAGGCDTQSGRGPQIASVDFGASNVRAPSSFRECTTEDESACDYRIVSKAGDQVQQGAGVHSIFWKLEVYRATPAGETFSVVVDPRSKVSEKWYERKIVMYDANMNTEWGGNIDPIALNVAPITVDLPIKGDFPLQVVGGKKFPVVGALPVAAD